ncbi:hypothetical protein IG631_07952 [Alternaria alternata]|nr:hypothetical protein IG631_07952 [Alternaria alternata]
MEPSPIATLLLLALPPDWQRGGGMVRANGISRLPERRYCGLLVPLPVEVALTRRLWHPIYSGPQTEDTELCHTWAVRRPFDLLQNSRMRDASCTYMR